MPLRQNINRIIRVHWKSGGDFLVFSFAGFATQSLPWLNDCRLIMPDGTSYPFFADINSIGVGRSANLSAIKTPLPAVFTADPVYTLSRTVTMGYFNGTPYVENYAYQTIFVQLDKFKADKDGNKVFSLSSLPAPRGTVTYTGVVPWRNDIPGKTPLDFTDNLYDTVSYDQQAAARWLFDTVNADLVSGHIFPDSETASNYVALHGGGQPFSYYVMVLAVQAVGPSYSCTVETFSAKSINGPADQMRPNDPPTLPGSFLFPLHVPKLTANVFTGLIGPPDGPENKDYDNLDWCIGLVDDRDPWPSGQWSPLSLSAGFDGALAITPPTTLVLKVLPGAKDIPASRIQYMGKA